MKHNGIMLKGFKVDAKSGRLVRDEKVYDVATQLKRRRGGSKRVRVGKKQGIGFL